MKKKFEIIFQPVANIRNIYPKFPLPLVRTFNEILVLILK